MGCLCTAGVQGTLHICNPSCLSPTEGPTQPRRLPSSTRLLCAKIRVPTSNGNLVEGTQRLLVSGPKRPRRWPAGTSRFGVRASSSVPERPDGDPKVQQMLVELLQAQMGEARVVDLVEQRSQELRDIAQQSSLDLDNIASRTMRGVDALGNRMLRELDLDIAGLEKELKIANRELEASNRDLEAFEIRMTSARNEGLFFKSLHSPTRSRLLAAPARNKQEVVVDSASNESLILAYRQILYTGLTMAIASFLWSATAAFLGGTGLRFSKLVAHGMIVTGLMIQVVYDKVVTVKDLVKPDDKAEEQ